MKIAPVVVLSAVALAASSLVAPLQASPPPDVTDTDFAPGVQIVDEEGVAAIDAHVEIFVTPPLEVGDISYRSRRVATAPVRDDGSVEFPTVQVQDLARFAQGDFVNLELNAASSDSGISSWSYSVKLPESGTVSLAPPPEDLVAPTQSAAAGKRKRRLARPSISNGRIALRPRIPSRRSTAGSWPCNQTRLIKKFKPWVTLAVVRSDHKRVSGWYSLSSSEESTVTSRLGVAIKDRYGLHIGGRVTNSFTWTVKFGPTANKAKQYESKWLYGKFRTKRCLRGVHTWEFRDKTEPIEHLKDIRVVDPGPFKAPHCRRTAPGQSDQTNSQRNVEWGGGVQLAAKGFAVDLTAQTGYSKANTVRFKWANNYKGRGYFCGQFAVPRNKSDEVVGSMIGS